MKHRFLSTLSAFAFFLLCPAAGFSSEPTGREIMELQKDRHSVESEVSTVVMLLVDDKSNKKTRIMKRWSKRFPDGFHRNLIVFQEPRDIAGTALLTWEINEGESAQWLYLPGTETLNRIASQGRKSPFMGTDFTYEDLQPDSMDDYTFQLKGSETLDGEACWLVEITPASRQKERESSYSRRLVWIRKDLYYPVKVEFYDRRGRHIKTQTNHDLIHLEGEAWTSKRALMVNHQTGHSTVMGLQMWKTGLDIEDSVFTERFILSGRHRE